MKLLRPDLTKLGWNDWFEATVDCSASDVVARVAAVDREQLLLMDQEHVFRAKLAGRFVYQHSLSLDFPCVGDWVCVETHLEGDYALIHSVLKRKTELYRKSPGDIVDCQMIAANIDFVVIVQSCHFDFNVNRLERYLVMVKEGGAEPFILLSKTDLVEPAVLDSLIASIRSAGITAPIMSLSNITSQGVNQFQNQLQSGKTYCFVGSSGVGKSTLINGLLGDDVLETKSVSATGEGRHATVRRELFILKGGALVIDNPGMREFGVLASRQDIDDSFSDINEIAAGCGFRDCTHTSEPNCAVIAAMESGLISQAHYENYLKLRNESTFHNLTYAEKRKKDRDFGRFIKTAKKSPGK